ncbi:MAG: LysM peptidoglycan-binding domain-containing protein [Nitrospirota bacterium]
MRHSAIILILAAILILTASSCAFTKDSASHDGIMPEGPAPREAALDKPTEAEEATAKAKPSREMEAHRSASQEDPLKDAEAAEEDAPAAAKPQARKSPVVSESSDPEAVLDEAEESAPDGQGLMDSALARYEASQQLWSEGNIEGAVEALDDSYDLILQVETDDSPELIQQKDDLRFMISKRILEVYASRYTAVSGNHEAIPLTMNEHVEAEIKRLTGPEKEFFLDSYRRSGKYRDMMVNALREAGAPEELSWLPLIESGFKVRALSRARALGLWQFIPSTGYKFGLSRDTWVDERLDPEKSTAAAIAYLEELHKIFGDWTTVLAAYNCGEGTVLRVIRKQSINYLDNFWDLYERLPRETARYVPRFLAVLHILKDPEKYDMDLDEPQQPMLADTVEVNKQMRLKDMAAKLGADEDDLVELNPSLRRQVTPDGPFVLRVPHGMGGEIESKLDEIPKWTPPKTEYVYHRVRRGESLSTIAARYGTSVSSIALANRLRSKHWIRAGQTLKIPVRGSARAYSKASLMPGGKYRVRKGDSLWLIARRFDTNTKTLKKMNGLDTTTLYVGQVLKIRQ